MSINKASVYKINAAAEALAAAMSECGVSGTAFYYNFANPNDSPVSVSVTSKEAFKGILKLFGKEPEVRQSYGTAVELHAEIGGVEYTTLVFPEKEEKKEAE